MECPASQGRKWLWNAPRIGKELTMECPANQGRNWLWNAPRIREGNDYGMPRESGKEMTMECPANQGRNWLWNAPRIREGIDSGMPRESGKELTKECPAWEKPGVRLVLVNWSNMKKKTPTFFQRVLAKLCLQRELFLFIVARNSLKIF